MPDNNERLLRLELRLEDLIKENEELKDKLEAVKVCLREDIEKVKILIESTYLKKETFQALFTPVHRVYWGVLGLLAMGVGTAIMNLVVKK